MTQLFMNLLFISVSFANGFSWSKSIQKQQEWVIGIITGRIVNVRSLPSLKGEVITKCRRGEPVKYIMKSERKHRIGKQVHYWHQVKTQDGRLGWVYGRFLKVLDEHTKGEDGILRDLIHREFHDKLYHQDFIFKNFSLKTMPFEKKIYYLFSYEWHDNHITSYGCSIYLLGEDYLKIADTAPGNEYYFYDLDSDGNAEIISLDKSRKSSVVVYSEKKRKEIFGYSFYSSGLFDLLEDINDSYIEVIETQPGKKCEIKVHIRENRNEPMTHIVYKWNGRTFVVKK